MAGMKRERRGSCNFFEKRAKKVFPTSTTTYEHTRTYVQRWARKCEGVTHFPSSPCVRMSFGFTQNEFMSILYLHIHLPRLSVCLSVCHAWALLPNPPNFEHYEENTKREKRKKTGEKRHFSLALFLPVSLPHILRTHTTTRSLLLGENERKEDGRNSLKKISSSGGSSNNAVVLLRNSHHFYYGLKLWIEFIHRETDRPTEAHFLESSFASCIFSTFLFWVHYGVESNPGKHEMV